MYGDERQFERATEQDLDFLFHEVNSLLFSSVLSPSLQEAILVASPILSEMLSQVKTLPRTPNHYRLMRKILRYLFRMTLRTTPFGLCAGSALLQISKQTNLAISPIGHHRKRTRVDLESVFALIADLEKQPEIADQLHWMPNSALSQSGRWMYLPLARGEEGVLLSMSFPISPLTRHVLDELQRGSCFKEIREHIQTKEPARLAAYEQVLSSFRQRAIIKSDLTVSPTSTDPLDSLIKRLDAISSGLAQKENLARIKEQCQLYDQLPIGEGQSHLSQLMRSPLGGTAQSLLLEVDYHMATTAATIGEEVANAIAKAATLLCRLSLVSSPSPALHAYTLRFLERYGEAREVPLLELLDDLIGLGPPATYDHPPALAPWLIQEKKEPPRRRHRLSYLAAKALKDRLQEIELNEEDLLALEGSTSWIQRLPHSIDLFAFISAPSQQEINTGNFLVGIGPRGSCMPAGRAFGRFCDLLGEEATQHIQHLATLEKEMYPDQSYLFAELLYLPDDGHRANVALRPAIYPYEIPLGVPSQKDAGEVISLSQLAVGITSGRLYLRAYPQGKIVLIRSTHLLNLFGRVPNLVRFLLEVAGDHLIHPLPFSWGSLASLPSLPRLRYQRILLSPATWNLNVMPLQTQPHLLASARAWYEYIQHWRQQWHVPRFVYLPQNTEDQRLLLDLENPLCLLDFRQVCQNAWQKKQSITLQEPVPSLENIWATGLSGHYLLEAVVSLQLSPRLRKKELPPPAAKLPPITHNDRLSGALREWIYCKLYCHEEQQDALLLGPLRLFLDHVVREHPFVENWFFIRYADPLPHIRLRFKGEPIALLSLLLPQLMAWIQELLEQKWIAAYAFENYEREIERYGGNIGMLLAEQLFTLDSAFSLDLMAFQVSQNIPMIDLAPSSLDLLFQLTNFTCEERIEFYRRRDRFQKVSFPKERKLFAKRFRPWKQYMEAFHESLSGEVSGIGNALGQLFTKHLQAHPSIPGSELWPCVHDPYLFWESILHMHCNRLHLRREGEEEAFYRIARYTFWEANASLQKETRG